MPEPFFETVDLPRIAAHVGTPFYAYSGEVLRRQIRDVKRIAPGGNIQARYAMKACSLRNVLEEIRANELWIDAVSGNEVVRAKRAGFPMGNDPPVVMLTADVFRDNALDVVCSEHVLPNIGSPAMIEDLFGRGYRGPIAIRVNPGFGHGHVSECDTGGPSSKHGLWYEDLEVVHAAARAAGLPIVLLHAHVGSGPQIHEFNANIRKLGNFFVERADQYPDLRAVNLGGGIPHPYRPDATPVDLDPLGRTLRDVQRALSERAGRQIRVEIEPGRYFTAPSAVLVTRVTDVKATRTNNKGPGFTFVMVDAGFCDLVRPAMYGSYHHITVHDARQDAALVPVIVAGPLCESGDVFTRDAHEMLDPRLLPMPRRGDLLVVHDAGAYGASMSSFYNSFGRVPQVWIDGGRTILVSRRETADDVMRNECSELLD